VTVIAVGLTEIHNFLSLPPSLTHTHCLITARTVVTIRKCGSPSAISVLILFSHIMNRLIIINIK
jgi:hypothetical protein